MDTQLLNNNLDDMESEALMVALALIFVALAISLENERMKAPIEYESFYWTLACWGEEETRRKLRFSKAEIGVLITHFELHNVRYRRRLQPSPELALCITIAKLARPRTLADLCVTFGVSETFASVVINDVLEYLNTRYRRTLDWNPLVDYTKMREYAEAIRRRSQGVRKVWGFIDGTLMGICRPKRNQRPFYTGYKKRHGIKYQAITTPDGLISHLSGPYEGRYNDLTMLRESGLEDSLEGRYGERRTLFLFGDQAYKQCRYIIPPFSGDHRVLSPRKRRFNDSLSSVRIAVENSFGLSQNLFLSNALHVELKKDWMPVASHYEVAVLLTNCFTCLRGNLISRRFHIDPPSIEDYLRQHD